MTVYTAKLRQGYLQPRRLGDNFAFAPDKLWEIARQRPSFDLDFTSGVAVNRGTLATGNLGTFTRPSSVKLVWNGTQFVSVAADTPALQRDPVSGLWGVLMEPVATNLLWRSAELSDATWGSQSTAPTVTADQIIAPDGTLTGDRIVFAAADSRRVQGGLSLTSGTVYTASVFARSAGATLNGFRIGTFDSGQQNSSDFAAVSTQWTRFSFTFTSASTTASGTFQLRNTFSPVANDLYFWGAQFELGPAATSPIVTSGSALTRNADSWVYTGTAFSDWYDQAGMTWVSSHTYTAGNNGGDQTGVWSASNGVASRGWGIRVTDNTDSHFQYRDDATNASLSGNPSTNSTTTRIATFASLATRSGSEDGKTVQSNSTLLSYSPTAFDRLRIGAPSLVDGAAGSRPILVHRITAFPPGNAQNRLQSLSAL